MLTALRKQRLDPNGSIFKQTNVIVKASYEVSLMIAKQKKAHTIGENLILPAANEMIRTQDALLVKKPLKSLTQYRCQIILLKDVLKIRHKTS